MRCLSRALSIPIPVSMDAHTHAYTSLLKLHGVSEPHTAIKAQSTHTAPSMWRRASVDLQGQGQGQGQGSLPTTAASPFISVGTGAFGAQIPGPLGSSGYAGAGTVGQDSVGPWRRSSVPNNLSTGPGGVKKGEITPWDDIKGNITVKDGNIPVSRGGGETMVVFYPRVLGAFCLDPSDRDLPPGSVAGGQIILYRNLLYSLSLAYPVSILNDHNATEGGGMYCNQLPYNTSYPTPLTNPNWLVCLMQVFSRDTVNQSRLSTATNATKQFLYKLFGALIPHCTLLCPQEVTASNGSFPASFPSFPLAPTLDSVPSFPSVPSFLPTTALAPTLALGHVPPYPPTSPLGLGLPLTSAPSIGPIGTGQGLGQMPVHHSLLRIITSTSIHPTSSCSSTPISSPTSSMYAAINHDTYGRNKLCSPLKEHSSKCDASWILSGFSIPLKDLVLISIRASSDPDHQLRVQAITVLGLLNPAQWMALAYVQPGDDNDGDDDDSDDDDDDDSGGDDDDDDDDDDIINQFNSYRQPKSRYSCNNLFFMKHYKKHYYHSLLLLSTVIYNILEFY